MARSESRPVGERPRTPPVIAAGQELPRLTSLRAFAAGIVFVYHIGHHTTWLKVGDRFGHGFVGVTFFFVLSGFVLTWATAPGSSVRDFYVRRIARVYPSHLAMALVAVVVPTTAYAVTSLAVVTNLSLTQAWFRDWPVVFGLNAVSWSLSCEAFFYLCAPWVIAFGRSRGRPGQVLLAAWVAVAVLASALMSLSGQTWDIVAYTNPLLRSGEFIVGVLLALRFNPAEPRFVRSGWASVAAVSVGAALVPLVLPQTIVNVLLLAPFAALVAAAASADAAGRRSVLHHRLVTYAGQASFAFYLVHELVILNVRTVVGAGATPLRGALWTGIALLASALAAVVLHEAVERPMQRIIRRRLLH